MVRIGTIIKLQEQSTKPSVESLDTFKIMDQLSYVMKDSDGETMNKESRDGSEVKFSNQITLNNMILN